MESNFTPEQVEDLKKQLDVTKSELNELRNEPILVQTNPQDKFLETLIDRGGELLLEYAKINLQNQQYNSDKEREFDKEELIVLNKMDTKEKLYKGLLIIVCIIAVVFSAMYIVKAEVIIPVLTLIIGLLFKSNSLSDFISHSRNKYKDSSEE